MRQTWRDPGMAIEHNLGSIIMTFQELTVAVLLVMLLTTMPLHV